MGKTLGAILTVGLAIAVNVIPGAGNFLSATILSSGIGVSSVATAVALSGQIITGLTIAGAVTGIATAASILAGNGPKSPKPEAAVSAIKSPTPPRVSAYGISRLYPSISIYETSTTGYAVDVGALHEGRIDSIVQWYLGDKAVSVVGTVVQGLADGSYGESNVQIYNTLGETPGTPFADIQALLPGIYTTDHRGDGLVAVALTKKPIKAEFFQKFYPQGDNFFESAAGKWQLCFDWRDVTQDIADPDTWKWTENSVLHLVHYVLVREKTSPPLFTSVPTTPEYDAAIAAYHARIEAVWNRLFVPTIDQLTDAADDCDIAQTLSAGGTEPRYRSCVAHKHTDTHKSVKGAILATFDGWIAPRADGALVVYSGRYTTPTVAIGADEIISHSTQFFVNDEDSVNELVVSYVSAPHDYATVETDAWVDEDDIAKRGRVNSQPLENQVPSHTQGRRLAKRSMSRLNAQRRGTVTTNSGGRAVMGQRYIWLTIPVGDAFFYDGPAEITALTRNLMTGGVNFSWIAADENIDAWNPATEDGLPAALGDRVASEPLETPTLDDAVLVPSDDGLSAQIEITATGPDRDDITWFARWRVVGTIAWNEQQYSDTDPGAGVTLITGLVPTDSTVEVEVAYKVGDGRLSAYSSPPVEVDTATDSELDLDGGNATTEA